MTKIRFKPMLYITLANILGFFIVFLASDAKEFSILYVGLGLSLINILVYALIFHFELGDIYLFLTASMLATIGFIMLYRLGLEPSSVYSHWSMSQSNKQLIWFAAGIIAYFATLICFGKLRFWNKLYIVYMAICFALLIATAVFGTELYGAKNWLSIGPIAFQPSEVLKIFFCLTIACVFSKIPLDPKKDKRKRFFGIPFDELILCAFTYICILFLIMQKELGTVLLLFLVYFSMTFVYRTNFMLKFVNTAGIILILAVGYMIYTKKISFGPADYIITRVDAWLDPDCEAGYQIKRSLWAITSGGYFGTGIGLGMPYTVPAAHSDFIFSMICEEMGIFTGIAVILLYFIMTYRGIKIAIKNKNEFLKASCMALVLSIGFQTFIIVGGVIKLIPMTGITMPFVSAGGSSMLVSFVMLGIITAFSTEKNMKIK